MPKYEYKVVPAPKKGLKSKGIKGTGERFASALMTAINELGAEGWEYQRSDTLPCEERSGVMGKSTTFLNMLVFRRKISAKADKAVPETGLAVDTDTTPEDSTPEDTTPEDTTPEDTAPETHAPKLGGVAPKDSGAAPELGPADEATEVKDPRADT